MPVTLHSPRLQPHAPNLQSDAICTLHPLPLPTSLGMTKMPSLRVSSNSSLCSTSSPLVTFLQHHHKTAHTDTHNQHLQHVQHVQAVCHLAVTPQQKGTHKRTQLAMPSAPLSPSLKVCVIHVQIWCWTPPATANILPYPQPPLPSPPYAPLTPNPTPTPSFTMAQPPAVGALPKDGVLHIQVCCRPLTPPLQS
jgi:hypothetical protein